MLIKANTLTGYKLDSVDGEMGKVEEFYFDDRHWTIRYLVADTGKSGRSASWRLGESQGGNNGNKHETVEPDRWAHFPVVRPSQVGHRSNSAIRARCKRDESTAVCQMVGQ
jgi:hypothetical protein